MPIFYFAKSILIYLLPRLKNLIYFPFKRKIYLFPRAIGSSVNWLVYRIKSEWVEALTWTKRKMVILVGLNIFLKPIRDWTSWAGNLEIVNSSLLLGMKAWLSILGQSFSLSSKKKVMASHFWNWCEENCRDFSVGSHGMPRTIRFCIYREWIHTLDIV